MTHPLVASAPTTKGLAGLPSTAIKATELAPDAAIPTITKRLLAGGATAAATVFDRAPAPSSRAIAPVSGGDVAAIAAGGANVLAAWVVRT